MCKRFKLSFLAAGVVSIFASVQPVNAQFDRPSLVPVKTSSPTVPKRTGGTRVVTTTRVETKIVKVTSLSVATEPGATVLLEPLAKSAKAIPAKNADNGIATFEGIPAGRYKVKITKEGFDPVEADSTIIAQRVQGLSLDLKRISYSVKVKTNLTGGRVYFANAGENTKNASTAVAATDLPNYCAVNIQPTGDALITNLQLGTYLVDVEPKAMGYEVARSKLEISEKFEPDGAGAVNTVDIKLQNKTSTEEFGTNWIPQDWNMPPTWRLDRGMKVRNVEGIALPQDERYRYYINFELIANVKLNDDGTIGFVFRARDQKNYYLLQISGKSGLAPNNALFYSVENGIPKVIKSATLLALANEISSDKGFTLRVTPRDGGFFVGVEDSNNANIIKPIATFIDPLNTFQMGAVGIAATPKSNFDVRFFRVCPQACK